MLIHAWSKSVAIIKAEHGGAQVVPHQDGCTSLTDLPSCTTFWYALEDANSENGCLAIAPRSHRVVPIKERCRRDENRMPTYETRKPLFAHVLGVSADVPEPIRDEKGDFV